MNEKQKEVALQCVLKMSEVCTESVAECKRHGIDFQYFMKGFCMDYLVRIIQAQSAGSSSAYKERLGQEVLKELRAVLHQTHIIEEL